MNLKNSKNYPKTLESKCTYIRITAPENLDVALEGLVRKVLKEQPKTDEIYAFAADYFETLLKIRDKAGLKKQLVSEICPFHDDEDAHEMIKLASTFAKPVGDVKMPRNEKQTEKEADAGKIKEVIQITQPDLIDFKKEVKAEETENKAEEVQDEVLQKIESQIMPKEEEEEEDRFKDLEQVMNDKLPTTPPLEDSEIEGDPIKELVDKEIDSLKSKSSSSKETLEEEKSLDSEHVFGESVKVDQSWVEKLEAEETRAQLQESEENRDEGEEKEELHKRRKRSLEQNESTEDEELKKEKMAEIEQTEDKESKSGREETATEVAEFVGSVEVAEVQNAGESSETEKTVTDIQNEAKSEGEGNEETDKAAETVKSEGSTETEKVMEEETERVVETITDEAVEEKEIEEHKEEVKVEEKTADEDKATNTTSEEAKTLETTSEDSKIVEVTSEEQKTAETIEEPKAVEITSEEPQTMESASEEPKMEDSATEDAKEGVSATEELAEVETETKSEETDAKENEESQAEETKPELEKTGSKEVVEELITKETENVEEKAEEDKGVESAAEETTEKTGNSERSEEKAAVVEDVVQEAKMADVKTEISAETEKVSQEVEEEVKLDETAQEAEAEAADEETKADEAAVEAKETGAEQEAKAEETAVEAKVEDRTEEFSEAEETKTDEETKADEPTEETKAEETVDEIKEITTEDAERDETAVKIQAVENEAIIAEVVEVKEAKVTETIPEVHDETKSQADDEKSEISDRIDQEVTKTEDHKESVEKGEDAPILVPQDQLVRLGEDSAKPEDKDPVEENVQTSESMLKFSESDLSSSKETESSEGEVQFISVQVTTVVESQTIDESEENDRPSLEIRVETGTELGELIDDPLKLVRAAIIIQKGYRRFRARKFTEKQLSSCNRQSTAEEIIKPDSVENPQLHLIESIKTDLKDGSSLESDSSQSSSATKIRKFDSNRRTFTRSTTKSWMESQSLDSIKRSPLTKTRSLSTSRQGITDFEVWSTIEKELEAAATKIQSNFRGYRTRKRLKREDAVQITTTASDASASNETLNELSPRFTTQHHTGEFHDSVVLTLHPL